MAPAEEPMAFERWTPRQDHTKQEEYLFAQTATHAKLFAFCGTIGGSFFAVDVLGLAGQLDRFAPATVGPCPCE